MKHTIVITESMADAIKDALTMTHFKFNSNIKKFLAALLYNPFMAASYIDHFDLGAAGNLYYTTNSDLNPKTSYHYAMLQLNVAGNLLSLFNPLMRTDEDTGQKELSVKAHFVRPYIIVCLVKILVVHIYQ